MQEHEQNYFKIKTSSLLDNSHSHFDVYTKIDDLILFAKAPYQWKLRELKDLLAHGIDEMYVPSIQKDLFERYLKSLAPFPELDPSLSATFRIKQIQDIGKHLIESCFISEINESTMGHLNYLSTHIVSCLREDPMALFHIETLAEHSQYTYIHSCGVGILAPAIALHMGITDERVLREYSLAGILHDIGKKDVPLQVLNKNGPLTPEEWKIMKEHPALGLTHLQGLGVSNFVTQCVGLHHEKLDGSGYPNGISSQEIPDQVKIVTVADIYSALTTARCYHFKRSRFEALMFMKHDLNGKISKEAFKALVSALAVDNS